MVMLKQGFDKAYIYIAGFYDGSNAIKIDTASKKHVNWKDRWKKFKEVMGTVSCEPSKANSCSFIETNGNKEVMSLLIIYYVDDGGIIGPKQEIDNILKVFSKDFTVKYLGEMKHAVGFHLIQKAKKDTIWVHQPKLLKNLKETFGEMVKQRHILSTPGAPRTVAMRPQEDDPLIATEDQKMFRSGAGMLLYLVKHSRPDIAYTVRELPKDADGATANHWNEMIHVIKYVLDTENYGLKLKPSKNKDGFYLEGVSDSEYAREKDTRISAYGYALYCCGATIAWKSKAGKSVTLSISQRTKYIDVRTIDVREFIEEGIIKVILVKSEDNDADIFTKKTSEEIFKRHSDKLIEEVGESDKQE
jgi:hypothetical protein